MGKNVRKVSRFSEKIHYGVYFCGAKRHMYPKYLLCRVSHVTNACEAYFLGSQRNAAHRRRRATASGNIRPQLVKELMAA